MKSLNAVAAMAALMVGTLSVNASAETLKVSTFVPPNHAFNKMLTQWGEELAEKSGGELTVDLFPAGQLGPPPRQYDLAATGAADIAVHLVATTPGRFPMAELAGMPLSYPSVGSESKVTSRRLTELADEYLASENPGTKILWMGVTPPLKINVKGDKPDVLSTLEGERIRYAGAVFQELLGNLGATPMPVSPGDVSESLSKGVIDGATFPYEALMAFDLGDLIDYSIAPGMASAIFSVVMNQRKFESLDSEMQQLIVDTTGPDRAEAFGAMWDAGEAEGEKYILSKGVEIVTLEGEELDKLTAAAEPIIDATVQAVDDSGKPGRAFFEAYIQ